LLKNPSDAINGFFIGINSSFYIVKVAIKLSLRKVSMVPINAYCKAEPDRLWLIKHSANFNQRYWSSCSGNPQIERV